MGETYGTEQGALTAEDITNIIKMEFDCRPGAIAVTLALREPKYQETAAYCHFGGGRCSTEGEQLLDQVGGLRGRSCHMYRRLTSSCAAAGMFAVQVLLFRHHAQIRELFIQLRSLCVGVVDLFGLR